MKYRIVAFIFILAIVVLLSGCGGGKENKTTIVIWHQMQIDGRAVLDSLCRIYTNKHPDIRIETLYKETEELRSGFQNSALANTGPQIIYGPSDQVGPFSQMDIIMPLENLISKDTLLKFDENSLTYFNGHLYQIGDRIGNHLALVYNKKMISKPPKTFGELIEIGKNITKDIDGDGKIDQYGLVWNFTEPYFFIPFLGGFGGWIMDEKANPTLNTQSTIDAFKFVVALRDSYRIIPRECDYNMADALFKEGRAAMIINGPWSWAGYIKAGIDIGISRIPLIEKTGLWPTPMISPKGYSINKNVSAELLPKVIDVIYYLTSPSSELAFTRVLGTIPSRLDARKDSLVINNPIIKQSKYQLDVGRKMPVNPELRAIWDAMRPSYQAVLAGKMTPEEAAKKMQEDAIRKIKEMRE